MRQEPNAERHAQDAADDERRDQLQVEPRRIVRIASSWPISEPNTAIGPASCGDTA
jgi:hypothetical protein